MKSDNNDKFNDASTLKCHLGLNGKSSTNKENQYKNWALFMQVLKNSIRPKGMKMKLLCTFCITDELKILSLSKLKVKIFPIRYEKKHMKYLTS